MAANSKRAVSPGSFSYQLSVVSRVERQPGKRSAEVRYGAQLKLRSYMADAGPVSVVQARCFASLSMTDGPGSELRA